MPATSAALLTAEEVLQRVFCDSSSSPKFNREQRKVHVIPQRDEPRWIILGNPRSAHPVLRSWAPWKAASRVRWNVVRCLAALNALPAMPGIQNSTQSIDSSYWRAKISSFPEQWTAVIHVGSPSHTRKAILFLIENGEHVVCAGKVPLIPGSAEAILNEGAILELLKPCDNFPKLLFRDPVRGVVGQSWLDGTPVSRGFSHSHLDLISSLAESGGDVRVSDVLAQIASDIEAADFPFDRSVLGRGVELLDYRAELHPFLEHRDFAPWNLKWIRPGVLGLLDWEWAVPNGLPWQDICRYFFLDDAHFHGPGKVWMKINSNPLLLQYRRAFDIPAAAIAPLTMRYLLGELLMEWNAGNLWLAEYAYLQIKLLAETISPIKA